MTTAIMQNLNMELNGNRKSGKASQLVLKGLDTRYETYPYGGIFEKCHNRTPHAGSGDQLT